MGGLPMEPQPPSSLSREWQSHSLPALKPPPTLLSSAAQKSAQGTEV